jgi:hypothetical protein
MGLERKGCEPRIAEVVPLPSCQLHTTCCRRGQSLYETPLMQMLLVLDQRNIGSYGNVQHTAQAFRKEALRSHDTPGLSTTQNVFQERSHLHFRLS